MEATRQEPEGYKMPFLGRRVAQGGVNVFAKSAKVYWRMWGLPDE
jgi:hypothetical protein